MRTLPQRLVALFLLLVLTATGISPSAGQRALIAQVEEEDASYRISFKALAFGLEGDPSPFVVQQASTT